MREARQADERSKELTWRLQGHIEKPIPSAASTLHPWNPKLRSSPLRSFPPPVHTPKLEEHPHSAQRLLRQPPPSPVTLLQHPEEPQGSCRLTHLLEIGESPAAQEKEDRCENCPHTSPPGARLPHPQESQPGAEGESLLTGNLAGVECGRPHGAVGGERRLCLLLGASSQGRGQSGS